MQMSPLERLLFAPDQVPGFFIGLFWVDLAPPQTFLGFWDVWAFGRCGCRREVECQLIKEEHR